MESPSETMSNHDLFTDQVHMTGSKGRKLLEVLLHRGGRAAAGRRTPVRVRCTGPGVGPGGGTP